MHKDISQALCRHLSTYVPTAETAKDASSLPYGTLDLHTITHNNDLPRPFQVQVWAGAWHIFKTCDGIPQVDKIFDVPDTLKGHIKFDTPKTQHTMGRTGQVRYHYELSFTCKIKESTE